MKLQECEVYLVQQPSNITCKTDSLQINHKLDVNVKENKTWL